jgi:hypothetical protein
VPARYTLPPLTLPTAQQQSQPAQQQQQQQQQAQQAQQAGGSQEGGLNVSLPHEPASPVHVSPFSAAAAAAVGLSFTPPLRLASLHTGPPSPARAPVPSVFAAQAAGSPLVTPRSPRDLSAQPLRPLSSQVLRSLGQQDARCASCC